MPLITYRELVEFYGSKIAHALLRVIEASSDAQDNVIFFDNETRLQRAFENMGRGALAA